MIDQNKRDKRMKYLNDEEKLFISAELSGIKYSYKDFACLYEYIFGVKFHQADSLKDSNYLTIRTFKKYWNDNGKYSLEQAFENQPELLRDKRALERLNMVADFVLGDELKKFITEAKNIKVKNEKNLEWLLIQKLKKAQEEVFIKSKKLKTVVKGGVSSNSADLEGKKREKSELEFDWWREQE